MLGSLIQTGPKHLGPGKRNKEAAKGLLRKPDAKAHEELLPCTTRRLHGNVASAGGSRMQSGQQTHHNQAVAPSFTRPKEMDFHFSLRVPSNPRMRGFFAASFLHSDQNEKERS